MFTGIVTDIGTIAKVTQSGDTRFDVLTAYDTDTIDLGASISHSGVCLTVIEKGKGADGDWFAVEASKETLDVTSAGKWQEGTKLNLERALKMGDELGGHIVTGHVDGLGRNHRHHARRRQPTLYIQNHVGADAVYCAERFGDAGRHIADRQ